MYTPHGALLVSGAEITIVESITVYSIHTRTLYPRLANAGDDGWPAPESRLVIHIHDHHDQERNRPVDGCRTGSICVRGFLGAHLWLHFLGVSLGELGEPAGGLAK